jgi:hypothetical protein
MRATLLALALLSTLAFPAMAEPNCGSMADWNRMLAEKYGEQEIRQGVSDGGHLMHLYMTPDGSTWTIVGEQAGTEKGCQLDGGTDLREPPAPEPDQGQGS